MKNKSLFSIFLVLIIAFSVSAISAQDVNEDIIGDSQTATGSVSGGVDVVTENPWTTSGELSYEIPSDAKTIKSADVYVNVYSGSAKNTHGANANITVTTNNGETKYAEALWIEEGSSDGTVYIVNDHTTKCYSDYMMRYDITDKLSGLNGTNIKVNVDTYGMANKTFDGRIKLIALVLAYDDGDEDSIYYWINDDQIWTKTNTTITFDTSSLTGILDASLTNIALSSSDGTYKLNGEFLIDADHKSGNYYQYNKWDLNNYMSVGQNTEFFAISATGGYASYKNVLSVLTVEQGTVEASVSLATERANGGYNIVYPGTYNQITITGNTNKNGKYVVQLLADGQVVNSTEIDVVDGTINVKLIDPTIRDIDASTVYAPGNFNNVTYVAKLLFNGDLIKESSLKSAVLYNGYFGKDFAYPGDGVVSFYNGTVTGDIVIAVSENAYASGTANRVDNWNVILPDNSNFVKAFVYVAYTYGGKDDENLFNVTFNGIKPTVVSFSRDQANVISTSGTGLIVYDVTDLIKSGENTFVLNKTHSAGAYPSTLIYLYNNEGSTTVKNIYISNGADNLGTYGNGAGRVIKTDSIIEVDTNNVIDATAYIFGAGALDGRATISINGEADTNAWNTSVSNQINIYEKNITSTLKDSNSVSIVLNNAGFTALQQIVVTTQKIPTKLTAPSQVTTVLNTNKNLVITLKDNAGNVIKGEKVTITLNGGYKQVLTTNDNGQVVYAINSKLTPKTYTAKVSYLGNDDYAGSATTSKVVVKKATPVLTAKSATFKVKTKTKKYTVTLKNNVNKVIKNAKVYITVKGKTYKAVTDSKGKAVFKITKLTKKGKYTAKVTYYGNTYYNKVVKSVKITVKK